MGRRGQMRVHIHTPAWFSERQKRHLEFIYNWLTGYLFIITQVRPICNWLITYSWAIHGSCWDHILVEDESSLRVESPDRPLDSEPLLLHPLVRVVWFELYLVFPCCGNYNCWLLCFFICCEGNTIECVSLYIDTRGVDDGGLVRMLGMIGNRSFVLNWFSLFNYCTNFRFPHFYLCNYSVPQPI